jgi:hypothetical protein
VARACWHIYSTREHGALQAPLEKIDRLPKNAVLSADGGWAELLDDQGVERVFVNLADARIPAARKDAA